MVINSHKPSLSRREQRAFETRKRLFRSALHLFAERGFSSVTVQEITETAGVGKGTFFNYFESKEQVLGVMAEIQLGKVTEALAMAADSGQSIHSILHSLFLRVAEEPSRSPFLARALLSSFLTSDGVRNLIARRMREGRGMIAQVVAAGQERGEINPLLDREQIAVQVLETFMGTVLFWSLHEDMPLNERMEDSFQHFWRAIACSGQKKAQEP